MYLYFFLLLWLPKGLQLNMRQQLQFEPIGLIISIINQIPSFLLISKSSALLKNRTEFDLQTLFDSDNIKKKGINWSDKHGEKCLGFLHQILLPQGMRREDAQPNPDFYVKLQTGGCWWHAMCFSFWFLYKNSYGISIPNSKPHRIQVSSPLLRRQRSKERKGSPTSLNF